MSKPNPAKIQSDAMVVIGKLGRPYGVRGWLALQSFTEPRENILAYQPWRIQTGQSSDWIDVADFQAKPHKDAFVAQINGIEDRDEAAKLTGSLIGVSRQVIDVLEEDEYLWHDLIGCQVTNLQGLEIGVVKELMETGAHEVLCIEPSQSWQSERQQSSKKPSANVLVPFTQAYVKTVDPQTKQIVVDWLADWA